MFFYCLEVERIASRMMNSVICNSISILFIQNCFCHFTKTFVQGARNDPGFNGNLKLAVAFGRNRGCSPGHEMKLVHLPRSAKLFAPFLARNVIFVEVGKQR